MDTESVDDQELADDTEVTASVSFAQTTRYSRFLLQLFGLWPQISINESRPRKFLRHFLSTFSIMGSFLLIIFKILNLLISEYSLTTSITDFFQIFRFLSTLYKMLILYTERKKITEMLECFTNFEVPKYFLEELGMLKKQISQPTKISLVFVFVLFIATPLIIFLTSSSDNNDYVSVSNDTFTLPIQIWHPFDFKENPDAYNVVYVLIMLTFIPSSFTILGFNMLYLSLAVICARMLDHLSIVLRSLHSEKTTHMQVTDHLGNAVGTIEIPSPSMRSGSPSEHQSCVVSTLRYAVQHHQRTIRCLWFYLKISTDVSLQVWIFFFFSG